MDIATHHDVFHNGHAGKNMRALERSGQSRLRDLVDRCSLDGPLVKDDASFLRTIETAQAIHQNGFSGAVRPDDCEELIRAHCYRHVVERNDAAECHSDAFRSQHRSVSVRGASTHRVHAKPVSFIRRCMLSPLFPYYGVVRMVTCRSQSRYRPASKSRRRSPSFASYL